MSSPLNKDVFFLTEVAASEMLERLAWHTFKPERILVISDCAASVFDALKKTYPQATLIELDSKETLLSIADQSMDLIFANFFLPWQADFSLVFKEWRRVLRPNGVLTFSAFGPDTLKEYHHVMNEVLLPQLMDMHDIGDLLLKEGFADPVLEVNHYEISYQDKEKWLKDLLDGQIISGLPADFSLADVILNEENKVIMTYEIVYAHAFAPDKDDAFSENDGVVKIPLSSLRKRLSSKD